MVTNEEILNEEWTLSNMIKAIGKAGDLCSLEWLAKNWVIANLFKYSHIYNLVNKQSN